MALILQAACQSDNASNISDVYSGFQARVCDLNSLAEWVPCAAHSLNLIGSADVECCPASVRFWGILQLFILFFSASPHRWSKHEAKYRCCAKHMRNKMISTKQYHQSTLYELFWNSSGFDRHSWKWSTTISSCPWGKVPKAGSVGDRFVRHLDWHSTKTNSVNKALREAGIELCTVVNLRVF